MKPYLWIGLFSSVVLILGLTLAHRSFQSFVAASIPFVAAVDNSNLFANHTPLTVTITSAGRRAPWRTTIDEITSSPSMWRRMHLADWNVVPEPLRHAGLDRMLTHYARMLNNPRAWDQMSVADWDAVPQPIRTVAYRRMTAYWAGYYDVGKQYALPPGTVAEMLAAIVMSESWFDHRATSVYADGTADLGLAQASPFARARIRQLHALGRTDITMTEEEYLDPWKATRFVAVWMSLMLAESRGDLDTAVRAYHRGGADAGDRLGTEYLEAVQRRLRRFIRNQDAPPAWDYLWRQARARIRAADRDRLR